MATPDSAKQRFDLGPFVAGIQNTRLTTHGGAFNWTRIAGPTVVNELRLGFAKTNPQTRQSDFGTKAAESLGIQGINVTEFTSGLPNINIADLTGISGGPAFLPVNPKQTHYQIEDSVAFVRGRHSLKTGYRFILRQPSPFTNTDTRSSISINRNLTNNPSTNSQGSGIATLLLGYTTGGARGFLFEGLGDFAEDDRDGHASVGGRALAGIGRRSFRVPLREYLVLEGTSAKEFKRAHFERSRSVSLTRSRMRARNGFSSGASTSVGSRPSRSGPASSGNSSSNLLGASKANRASCRHRHRAGPYELC